MTHEFCSIFIRNTAKQGRSLTHTKVTLNEIQHDQPFCLDNHRQSFWQLINRSLSSVCPGLVQPRSRSELASANQCLKVCDDAPSVTTLSTLNNPHPDCSAASLLVQWTQAHWNEGKRQCDVNGVQALRPAGTRSRCSRYT